MNKTSVEFNTQLELDVLVNGLTEVTDDYVAEFDWQYLNEVIIPKGVTSIGDNAFERYRSLKSVTMPDSVKSIGDFAFMSCKRLTNITIPDSVTSIGDSAFYMCENLTSITIPEGVKSIGMWAFYACKRLTNITFKGKTVDEVEAMNYYPWDIPPKNIRVQVP